MTRQAQAEQTASDTVAGLFREHGLSLVRLAVLLTGDRATAEDVVQDAFLGFQRALPRLRDDDKALAYLRASVVNGSRSVLRSRGRVRLRRDDDDRPVSSAEAAVMAEQDRRLVRSWRAGPWGRWLAPLAAAAAVAVIVIAAAVAVPRDSGQPPPTRAMAAGTPKFLIASTGTSPLQVRNASTGVLVASVTVPQGYPGGNSRTYITAVTTWNGRDYLVAEYANPCRSWIYRFRLDSAGRPSALTPFAALPTVRSELYSLTVSAGGQMVGFATTACQGAKPQPNYLGVTNVRTGHTTRWTAPSGNAVDTVSLTADGRQLCYILQGEGPPSLVRVIPTSAAPGSAARIGRTVARAQPGHWISFAAISADGGRVYFSTFTQPSLHQNGPMTGQIRVTDLATGRSRQVYAPAGQPGLITPSPGARYLLLQVPPKLVRLDLASGKVTSLPAGRFGLPAVLYW